MQQQCSSNAKAPKRCGNIYNNMKNNNNNNENNVKWKMAIIIIEIIK